MHKKLKRKNALVIQYLTLRKVIGFLGTSLPFVLFFGALVIFGTGIQSSISYYYHTGMGDVFVGILCIIGFFLLSYKGYEGADNIAGNLGCIFAVGVALFPTTPDIDASEYAQFIGKIHFAFSVLFFLTLIYFSLRLFTKTDQNLTSKPRKNQRNKIYRVCGYTMILCIVLISIYLLLPKAAASCIKAYNPVFWLEAIAILAFGISWLTKGEALSILNDEPE